MPKIKKYTIKRTLNPIGVSKNVWFYVEKNHLEVINEIRNSKGEYKEVRSALSTRKTFVQVFPDTLTRLFEVTRFVKWRSSL